MRINSNPHVRRLGTYGKGTISVPLDILKTLNFHDKDLILFTSNLDTQEIILKKAKVNILSGKILAAKN